MYNMATLAFSIKEKTRIYVAGGQIEGLFEANCLSAELDVVRAVGFGSASLVLYGNNARVLVDFNNVAYTMEGVHGRAYLKPARDAYAGTAFTLACVCFFMKHISLRRAVALGPLPLDVNQRALPWAVQVVLQRGERD